MSEAIQTSWRPADPNSNGNVLVEKVPTLPSYEEIFTHLRRLPKPLTADLLEGDISYRIEFVDDLQNVFVPMEHHFRAFTALLSLIRTGYFPRDPRNPAVMRNILQGSSGKHNTLPNQSESGGGCNGMTITGPPGMGKTSLIQRFKKFLGDQVEYHMTLDGRPCKWPQIKYLHIQCPSSESVAWLADAAADEIDSLLGTGFSSRFGVRTNQNQYVTQMERTTSSHFLGCLMVDDLQNLRQMNEKGAQGVLMTLCNYGERTGIPILIAATYRAVPVLERELMYVSKLTSRGEINFPALEGKCDEWKMFAIAMWSGFPAKVRAPMPVAFPEMLHWHSGGILRIAREMSVFLFKYMLRNGLNVPTMPLMDAIAADELRKYQSQLQVLRRWRRSSDSLTRSDTMQFPDLIPPQIGLVALRSEIAERGSNMCRNESLPLVETKDSGTEVSPTVPKRVRGKRPTKKVADDVVGRILKSKNPYEACRQEGWVLDDITELR